MKIALSQIKQIQGNDQHRMDNMFTETMQEALNKAVRNIELARKQNCDLICFSQWFIGFGIREEMPNVISDQLTEAAAKHNINIVTGTLRLPSLGIKTNQVSVMIDNKGEIKGYQGKRNLYQAELQWFTPEEDINSFETVVGRIVISHGDDCLNSEVYEEVKKLKPDIWVLQANHLISPEKILGVSDNFENVICRRSEEMGCVICVPMMLGYFLQVDYRGGSCIFNKGNKIAGMNDEEDMLICEIG